MAKKVTEKGPKPLRGIRNPDLYPSNGNVIQEAEKLYSQTAYDDYSSRTGNIGWNAISGTDAFNEKHYTPDNPLWGLGSSRWDADSLVNATPQDMQDARAQNQPWWSQWGSGVGKMLGTIGTTVVDGTVGTLAGLIQGTQNLMDDNENTGFLDGLWNNKITNAMAEVSEAMEEALPNYQTQWEQNAPFWKRMFSGEGGANFWANDILKNAGFTIGAAASIYLTGGIGGALGKGLSGLGKLAKLTDAAGDLTKAGKFAKWTANTFASTVGEASTEALNTYRDNKKLMDLNSAQRENSLKQQYLQEYQENLAKGMDPLMADNILKNHMITLEEDMTKYKDVQEGKLIDASNAVLGVNMAVLALSNNLTLGSMIRGGYGNAKTLLQRAVKTVDGKPVTSASDIAKGMINGTFKFEPQQIKHGMAKTAGLWALESTQEGLEEGAQNLASATAQMNTQAAMNKWAREYSTLGSQINPDAAEELTNVAKALGAAYEENFGTAGSQGWTEVAAGFISGALGVAHVHRNKQGKIRPTWQGGLKEAHEQIYGEKAATEEAVGRFQEAFNNGKFVERVKHAVNQLAIKSKQDEALAKNDTRGFKNAEMESMVANAIYAREMGLVDAYMEMFDELGKGLSDNDLTELKALATDKETQVSSLEGLSDEEIKTRYQEKAKSAKEKLQKAIEDYDLLYEQEGGKYSDETRSAAVHELSFKSSLMWDTYRRIDDLTKEVEELEAKKDKITPAEKSLLDEKQQAIKDLNKQAKTLREQLNDFKAHPEKLQKQIEQQLNTARKQQLYKDAAKAIEKYKEANTMADIQDVYDNSLDTDKREDVLNQAIAQAEGETKEKLTQFKNFMGDTQIVEDSINDMLPLGSEEDVMKNLHLNLFLTKLLEDTKAEMLADDSPVLTRETLKEKFNKKLQELKVNQHVLEQSHPGLDVEGEFASWQRGIDEGLVDENDVEYNLNEAGEEVPTFKKGSDLEAQFLALQKDRYVQSQIAELEKVIANIDNLDELRKTAKKPDPAKSPRGKNKPKPEGKKSTVTTSKGDEFTSEDFDADTDDEEVSHGGISSLLGGGNNESHSDSNPVLLTEAQAKMFTTEDVKGASGITYHVLKKLDSYEDNKDEKAEQDILDKNNKVISLLEQTENSITTYLDSSRDSKTQKEKHTQEMLVKLVDLVQKTAIGPKVKEDVEKFLSKYIKVAPKKVDKSTAPTYEEQKEAEEIKELSETSISMKGVTNPFYVDTKSTLKDGKLIRYNGNEQALQHWLKENGLAIDISIVDRVMPKVLKRDKNKEVKDQTPVYYLHHSDRPNDILLAYKLSDVIDVFGEDKVPQVISINDENYILIGNLGYDTTYQKGTKEMLTSLKDEIEKKHEGEGWYVHDKTNRVKDHTSGYIINQDMNDDEPQVRTLSYLLSDAARNPDGITAENAKWLVIEGKEGEITEKHINIDTEKEKAPGVKNGLPGQVYMYVKDNHGNNVPLQIETIFYKEMLSDLENPEHPVNGWTKRYFDTLADPEASMEDKKNAYLKLNDYFVFSDVNRFYVNAEDSKVHPNSIWAKINGRNVPIIEFDEETTMEENRKKLEEAMLAINPRMAINTSILEKSPQDYINAGIIRTNAAYLGTKASKFFVFPLNESNEYTENKPHSSDNFQPSFNSRQKVYLNGNYYYTDGESFYNLKGDKVNDTNGDIATAYAIKQGKIRATPTKNATYYLDGDNVYTDNGHGGITLLDDKEAKKAKNIINREKAERKRQRELEKLAEEEKSKEEPSILKPKNWNLYEDELKDYEGTITPKMKANSIFNFGDHISLSEAYEYLLKTDKATADALEEIAKEHGQVLSKTKNGQEEAAAAASGLDKTKDTHFGIYKNLVLDDFAGPPQVLTPNLINTLTTNKEDRKKLKALYDLAKGDIMVSQDVIDPVLYIVVDKKAMTLEDAYSKFISKNEDSNFNEETHDVTLAGGGISSLFGGNTEAPEGKPKKNFVNGANIDELKDAKDLEDLKNSSTFVAELGKNENFDKLSEFMEVMEEKGYECNNIEDLTAKLAELNIDLTSGNLDTILEILKNCRK